MCVCLVENRNKEWVHYPVGFRSVVIVGERSTRSLTSFRIVSHFLISYYFLFFCFVRSSIRKVSERFRGRISAVPCGRPNFVNTLSRTRSNSWRRNFTCNNNNSTRTSLRTTGAAAAAAVTTTTDPPVGRRPSLSRISSMWSVDISYRISPFFFFFFLFSF